MNFDIRGFDTLGEEFILFTSVMGTVLLMRRQKDESAGDHEDQAPGRVIPPASDAVRVTSLALVPITLLFGLYITTHGQITPGGGFQGGVILASAPLLLYLCAEYRQFRSAAPEARCGFRSDWSRGVHPEADALTSPKGCLLACSANFLRERPKSFAQPVKHEPNNDGEEKLLGIGGIKA